MNRPFSIPLSKEDRAELAPIIDDIKKSQKYKYLIKRAPWVFESDNESDESKEDNCNY